MSPRLAKTLWALATYPLVLASLLAGCDTPHTYVVIDNNYSLSTSFVIYRAFWQSASFPTPVPPGSSSDPQAALPASANTAYVVLAPNWNPASSNAPTAFIVMQSRSGFELHLDHTLHIPVDDVNFVGNCSAGSILSQDEADLITQRVFADTFTDLRYDATTCTTTPIDDSGGPRRWARP